MNKLKAQERKKYTVERLPPIFVLQPPNFTCWRNLSYLLEASFNSGYRTF